MTIKLLTHHVLVKLDDPIEADELLRRARAAGIEVQLDKREQDAVEYGTVITVGPTAFKDYGRNPDILKGGDRISLIRYAGKSIKDSDGTKYLVLNDSDVLCVIE